MFYFFISFFDYDKTRVGLASLEKNIAELMLYILFLINLEMK
jgi:hypothetical protein